jgi:hypothetical protein
VTRRVSILLLAAGGWTLFVWITRLVNMAGEDRSVGFYVVHATLAVISIGFGVAIAVVGWKALRQKSQNGVTRSPDDRKVNASSGVDPR